MCLVNGIVGVLAVFAAFFCFFRPGESVLGLGWLVAWVLVFWGIGSVANFFLDRKRGEASKQEKSGSVIGLVAGLAVCAVSLLSIFRTDVQLLTTRIVLVIMGAALVVFGVVNLLSWFSLRKAGGRNKLLPVLGILEILAGAASVTDFLFAADLAGILIGIMLAVFGISMLVFSFSSGSADWFDRI